MPTLILLLVVGSALVYISKFNFALVSVNFGPYVISNIPLFYVIIGSVVTGILLSYLANLLPAILNFFALRGKNSEIKKGKDEVLELTKQVHQLELKNERQSHPAVVKPEDPNSL